MSSYNSETVCCDKHYNYVLLSGFFWRADTVFLAAGTVHTCLNGIRAL